MTGYCRWEGFTVADILEYLPWTVAERLFAPDSTGDDPGILQSISTSRSVIGFLLVVYVSLMNGVWPFDELDFVKTATIAAFVAAAWVGLLLLWRRRPLSDFFKNRCRKVLRRVFAFFASVAIGAVVLRIPGLDIIAAFWLFFFTWWSFWLICKYQFGAGDANPLLTPLVTASTAVVIAAYNLATIHLSQIPLRLDELMVLSGAGTISLLSLAEALLLRHRGERLFTESVGPTLLNATGNLLTASHPGAASAANPYPWADHPARNHRRRSLVGAARIIVSVVAVAVLPLLLLGLQEIAKNGEGRAVPSQQTATADPESLANAAQGTLTIRPDHDYILATGLPYSIARVGGADVGHLTGTAGGVDVADAYVLPPPSGSSGSYQSCLALNWTSAQVWGVNYVIPWAALWPGRQLCVQTTCSGLYISLLTVSKRPAGEQVVFQVDTWRCNARPDESAIC
jgi:hypothetical protein